MPSKSTRKRFANRAEETAWWEANEEAVADSFERALNEGYTGPCTVVVTGDSTATRIRLGSRDVAKTHTQAVERGLRHQVYLKTIIHEAMLNTEAGPKAGDF
jgi:predicted DNA binding CopG/RHH family protein